MCIFTEQSFRFVLCIALSVWCCAGICRAEKILIRNVSAFNCLVTEEWDYGKNLDAEITLEGDIDFSVGDTLHRPISFPLLQNQQKAFNGTLNGKGHKIMHLAVRKADDTGAAFFYALENATISDLVFDGSCSFNSTTNAAALALFANYGVVIQRVVNNATVHGTNVSSGLIGEVKGGPVFIDQCQNNGNVTLVTDISTPATMGGYTNGSFAGGFIGLVNASGTMNVTIQNSINRGFIQAKSFTSSSNVFVGGFIGMHQFENGSDVKVLNSSNKGGIEAQGQQANSGGFIGLVEPRVATDTQSFIFSIYNSSNSATVLSSARNKAAVGGFCGSFNCCEASISVSNSANHGSITKSLKNLEESELFFGGGLFGLIQGTDIIMELTRCNNSGSVDSPFNGQNQCNFYASGFVGLLDSKEGAVSCLNCVNSGQISCSFGNSSGFFASTEKVEVTILNSANLGSVKGEKGSAHGICSFTNTAHSVVNTDTSPFWQSAGNHTHIFGAACEWDNKGFLMDNCSVIKEKNGSYFFFPDGEASRVDEVLNEVSSSAGHGWMLWSSNLDLTDYLAVRIMSVLVKDHAVNVSYGTVLGTLDILKECFDWDNCSVVDAINGTVYFSSTSVKTDMTINMTTHKETSESGDSYGSDYSFSEMSSSGFEECSENCESNESGDSSEINASNESGDSSVSSDKSEINASNESSDSIVSSDKSEINTSNESSDSSVSSDKSEINASNESSDSSVSSDKSESNDSKVSSLNNSGTSLGDDFSGDGIEIVFVVPDDNSSLNYTQIEEAIIEEMNLNINEVSIVVSKNEEGHVVVTIYCSNPDTLQELFVQLNSCVPQDSPSHRS